MYPYNNNALNNSLKLNVLKLGYANVCYISIWIFVERLFTG